MAQRVPYGSLKNKNGEYVWWFVFWQLPNVPFQAQGRFLHAERDEFVGKLAWWRALIGVGILAFIANVYPGYLRGAPEAVETSGRLWPGVGTLLRFAGSWEASITNSIILAAIWIALFTLLILPIARLRALPDLLLHLCWPVGAIALFTVLFSLLARAGDWINVYYNTAFNPSTLLSVGLLAAAIIVGIWFFKAVYLVATDVFRADDGHPLLGPFVTTGVSWTLAYLALSSGAPLGLPIVLRLLVVLGGPASVTALSAWACWRVWRDHGDLLFLNGSPDRAGGQGASGLPRRGFLRMAVPPAIVIGSSFLWFPEALSLASTRSNQVVAFLTTGPPIPNRLRDGALVTSVAFSPDGRTLAFGTTDGLLELWNVTDPGRPVPPVQPLIGQVGVSSVAFNLDRRTLATGSGDGTIQLWNVADPARTTALGDPLRARHQVVSVAFSPDGRILSACGNDGYDNFGVGSGTIQLWDVTDPARPTALGGSGTAAEGYSSVALSPDGRTLAAGTMLSAVELWDVANPSRPALLGSLRTSSPTGYTLVAFSPRGHTLAGGNSDGAIYLWDVADPARPAVLGPPLTIPDEVSSVAFSPDGRTLAASSNRGFSSLGPYRGDGTIRLWDIGNPGRPGRPSQFATAPVPGFCSVAFSPDGRTLASGGDGGSDYDGGDGYTPGSAQLWNITDPAHPVTLGGPLG
jgi:WD40 repeat protein